MGRCTNMPVSPPSNQMPIDVEPAVEIAPGQPLNADEAQEFARVMGVDAASICPSLREARRDDDDRLIEDYRRLVADPLKSKLAPDPTFFHRIKLDVARQLLATYLPGRAASALRVLDVGCGTGELLSLLRPAFGHVRGCDPSTSMVRRAGEGAVYMESPTKLPFAAQSFDVVVCACVYHHIEPALRARHLAEIQRVLAPGGVLMIFEHNPRNPLTRHIVRRCPLDAAAHLLHGWETAEMLYEAGFSEVRNRYYLFLPQSLHRHFGWLERYLSFTTLGGQYCTIGRNGCVSEVWESRFRADAAPGMPALSG